MTTQIGNIATLLSSVEKTKSPLQRELDKLTKVLGVIAWSAVAVIVLIGIAARPVRRATCCSWPRRWPSPPSRPACPTFVQAMLAYGARQLADAKAVVANLNDVETLGATSSINSDKTGTLTLNEMTVTALYTIGQHFTVEGSGYAKTGQILQAAGADVPDLTPLAYGLCLASDATVSDDGAVIGDPTEAALVVLAAKLGDRRRGEPPDVPARRGGAVRLGVQVHGHRPLAPVARRPDARRGGQGRPGRRAAALHARPRRSRPDRPAGGHARRHRGGDGAARRAGAAHARLRDAVPHAGRRGRPGRRPDVLRRGARVRRPGRHRRPAAAHRQGGRRDRAEGRHRGPHDHRRPRGDRERDRPASWASARARSADPSWPPSPTRSCWSGCRTCTCSAASPPRTSSGSSSSCRSRASSSP